MQTGGVGRTEQCAHSESLYTLNVKEIILNQQQKSDMVQSEYAVVRNGSNSFSQHICRRALEVFESNTGLWQYRRSRDPNASIEA